MGKPLKSAVIDIFGQGRVERAFERAASAPPIGLDVLAQGERALEEGPEQALAWLEKLDKAMADSFLVTACIGAVSPKNALNSQKKANVRMTLTIDSDVMDELDVQAQRLGLSRAAVARMTINAGLSKVKSM